MPTKRGLYSFERVYVRVESKLKLCMRIYVVELKRAYKVYPNLKDLRKYKLGIKNNILLKQGIKSLKIIGRGTAFESLREYVPNDEYRSINWMATARENKPIVNQYEPEKNQHVYILIDSGRPMSYTIRGYRKLDMAVNTALILSDIVNENGDLPGLLTFNTEINKVIAPGKGIEHRNKIMDALYGIDYTNNTSNYDEVFYYLKRKEKHRSIIFMFTDFDTTEESERMLKVLPAISKNNLVVIVLIKDTDTERIVKQKAETIDEIFNKSVAMGILEERRKTIKILNKKGIFCIECYAEKLPLTVINKYLQIKNKTYM
jgi:uncharacterized protein (DUF58 family)